MAFERAEIVRLVLEGTWSLRYCSWHATGIRHRNGVPGTQFLRQATVELGVLVMDRTSRDGGILKCADRLGEKEWS